MEAEEIRKIVHVATRGNTSEMEQLFLQPGGRSFLETTILVFLQHLPITTSERSDHFHSFLTIMQQMEERLGHQKTGSQMLKGVFSGGH